MPRNGPVPLVVHAMLEPVVALIFILGPFVLDLDDSTASTLSLVIGAVILAVGLTARWRLSLFVALGVASAARPSPPRGGRPTSSA